jgi:hypothetical protein
LYCSFTVRFLPDSLSVGTARNRIFKEPKVARTLSQ